MHVIFNEKSFNEKFQFTEREEHNNNKTRSENTIILCMQ